MAHANLSNTRDEFTVNIAYIHEGRPCCGESSTHQRSVLAFTGEAGRAEKKLIVDESFQDHQAL